MDELQAIDRHIGTVKGMVGLQFFEQTEFAEGFEFESFPEKAPPQKKYQQNSDGEEVEVEEEVKPVEEEEGDDTKPRFNPEKYQWTISNRI